MYRHSLTNDTSVVFQYRMIQPEDPYAGQQRRNDLGLDGLKGLLDNARCSKRPKRALEPAVTLIEAC